MRFVQHAVTGQRQTRQWRRAGMSAILRQQTECAQKFYETWAEIVVKGQAQVFVKMAHSGSTGGVLIKATQLAPTLSFRTRQELGQRFPAKTLFQPQ